MPVGVDRAGVGELPHLHVGAAVAQHLDPLRAGRGVAAAVQRQIGAEAAGDVPHRLDPIGGRRVIVQTDGRFGSEFAAELKARALRGAHHDHPSCAQLLRCRRGQHADGSRALHDHGRPRREPAGAGRPAQRPHAGGQRLGQRRQPQRHVVRQRVHLGAGQLLQVDVDLLGPSAPQVRRPLEAQVAAVVDRRQALVGGLRVVDAVVAAPARHQRRQHHLGAHRQRPAHVILGQVGADGAHHAGQLVTERERPRQRLRPVAGQDVQVGAAHPAGGDADQRRLARDLGHRHLADDRTAAGAVEGGHADALAGSTVDHLRSTSIQS